MKVAAGEGPLEGRCCPLIVALEGKETLLQFGQGGEIVGREDLALNDGEVDFDLVEPTGVDRSVDENGIGPFVPQTLGSFLAPMSGAVVHDPEDTTSGFVGFLAHDLADEAIHRSNPVLDFAAAKDFGAMDVPSRQVGPGAFTKVFVLDPDGAIRSGWQSRLFSASGLDAGFFVRRDNKVIRAQRSTLPNAFVQIQDGTGFGSKVGIARKDPASVLPRTERIAAEPAP